MPTIKDVQIHHGEVKFVPEIEATPTTTKTEGNVTINNMGQPGYPAYFDVGFFISVDIEESGLESMNSIHWNVPVQRNDDTAPYREVETQAALLIAPMLRAAADLIEKKVRSYEQNSATSETDSS